LLETKALRSKVIRVGLAGVLLVFPAYRLVSYLSLVASGDTRRQAARWLATHDYSSMRIAREIHDTPLLPVGYGKPVMEEWTLGNYNISELRKRGVTMLIISPGRRFLFMKESAVYKNYMSFLDSLLSVAHFENKRSSIACNPEIEIFLVPELHR